MIKGSISLPSFNELAHDYKVLGALHRNIHKKVHIFVNICFMISLVKVIVIEMSHYTTFNEYRDNEKFPP